MPIGPATGNRSSRPSPTLPHLQLGKGGRLLALLPRPRLHHPPPLLQPLPQPPRRLPCLQQPPLELRLAGRVLPLRYDQQGACGRGLCLRRRQLLCGMCAVGAASLGLRPQRRLGHSGVCPGLVQLGLELPLALRRCRRDGLGLGGRARRRHLLHLQQPPGGSQLLLGSGGVRLSSRQLGLQVNRRRHRVLHQEQGMCAWSSTKC